MISFLDTHETVKRLTAAGCTDAQAEALTAAVKNAVGIDLSNIPTKPTSPVCSGKWQTSGAG
jgi:hypothetical protein